MFVHIFANQTTYSRTLLNMLEEEINLNSHIFIFGLGRDHSESYQYSEEMQKRIYFLKQPRHLLTILKYIYNAEWIYIHLLAYDPTLVFWYLNKKLLRKSTWIVWGSDIYAFQKQNQSLRTRVYEWLRRRIIPAFPEIAAFVQEDFNLIASVYRSTAIYQPILYPLPVNLTHLDKAGKDPRSGSLVVMIGNSGDPTNNHIEMLDLLSVFNNKDMKVVCPLAYGGSAEYKQLVISKGISTFGNNFVPWSEMKCKQEYAKQLAGVDIALMNHERQQGLGNILALLYLNKKVYLRSSTTSFAFLLRNDCKVFRIEALKEMDFAKFSEAVPEALNNRTNVEKIMRIEFAAGLWKNLLKQH